MAGYKHEYILDFEFLSVSAENYKHCNNIVVADYDVETPSVY
jgi:hypothetical protein